MYRYAKWMAGSVALAMLATAGAAYAQRDPAYESARQSGIIGELPTGYLGFVVTPTAAIRAMVDDINIKRKDAYTKRAAATNSTVEQFAFTTGCNLIAKTAPGEKYQSPDGVWRTRGSEPPMRDSRCL